MEVILVWSFGFIFAFLALFLLPLTRLSTATRTAKNIAILLSSSALRTTLTGTFLLTIIKNFQGFRYHPCRSLISVYLKINRDCFGCGCYCTSMSDASQRVSHCSWMDVIRLCALIGKMNFIVLSLGADTFITLLEIIGDL